MGEDTLSVQEIASLDAFLSLLGEWNTLLKESKQDSIFLRHEWYQCCWTGLDVESRPMILLVRKGEELIGAAALSRYIGFISGFRVRKIGFLLSPDSFHADFIIRERREEVLGKIMEYLLSHPERWDMLCLSNIPAGSETYPLLEKIAERKRMLFPGSVSCRNLLLPLVRTWDDFYQERSVRFKKTHRNILNRAQKLGSVTVEVHTRLDTIEKVWDDVVGVSEKSWKVKAGVAISSREETKRFFRELTRVANEAGWLMIWLLRVDGVPVAMEYDLTYHGKVYGLRSDYDESFSLFSPGSYLNYQIVKSLFDDHYLEYDMGPGMNDYKTHWTETCRESYTLEFFNFKIYSRLLFYLEHRLISSLRRVEILRRAKETVRRYLWREQ